MGVLLSLQKVVGSENHSSDTKSSTVKLCHCDAGNWTVQRAWACSYWDSSFDISWITSVRNNRPDSGFSKATEYLKYSSWVLTTASLTQTIQLLQILSVRNEASGSSAGQPQVRQMLFPWLRTPLPSGTLCALQPQSGFALRLWCYQHLIPATPDSLAAVSHAVELKPPDWGFCYICVLIIFIGLYLH